MTTYTRTRDRIDLSFHQARHGERHSGQTPAQMLCEEYGASRLKRAMVVRRTKADTLRHSDNLTDRASFLAAVLNAVDGHLAAFEADDYSCRLIVLDPDADHGHVAWIELLHDDVDTNEGHPELGR